MKQLLSLLVITTLTLISCSTEETITEQTDSNSKMLESFVVKRNADGNYVLTTNVQEGVGTIYYDNTVKNQVYLITDNNATRNSLNHNYNVINNQLSIEFVAENNTLQPKLSIVDNNTTNRTTDYGLLNTYSLTSNDDGTIQLNFEVKDGVDVSFGYNENENINDIYLIEDTNATDVSFSKNYATEADGTLRIDFIQSDDSSRESDTKKPRIIYDCPTC